MDRKIRSIISICLVAIPIFIVSPNELHGQQLIKNSPYYTMIGAIPGVGDDFREVGESNERVQDRRKIIEQPSNRRRNKRWSNFLRRFDDFLR